MINAIKNLAKTRRDNTFISNNRFQRTYQLAVMYHVQVSCSLFLRTFYNKCCVAKEIKLFIECLRLCSRNLQNLLIQS